MVELAVKEKIQEELLVISEQASGLALMNNVSAAFTAVSVVGGLKRLLTKEIMEEVFMPLMNSKIGFKTDRDGKTIPYKKDRPLPLYSVDQVRDCIIDCISFGLAPTFNQMNIIAGQFYPTKEGFTVLLSKIKAKHIITYGLDQSKNEEFAEIPCNINFEFKGEKGAFKFVAVVKKNRGGSYDQYKGKAERKAKKALYEYLTGIDMGDNEIDGPVVIDPSKSVKPPSTPKQTPEVEEAEIVDENPSGEPPFMKGNEA